jgi:5'(3')-deoxyribonucleotidase
MIKLQSLLEEVADANLLEQEQIITLYLDMDGVLADFDLQFENLTNEPPSVFERKKGTKQMWSAIFNEGSKFWSEMQPMPDFHIFREYILKLKSNPKVRVEILTSTSAEQIGVNFPQDATKFVGEIEKGKAEWIQKYLPGTKINYAVSGTDKSRWATKSSILIDDLYKNIEQFIAAGGEGIVYRNGNQAMKDINTSIGVIKETCGYSWSNI